MTTSEKDGGALKKVLRDHTLHEVQAGKHHCLQLRQPAESLLHNGSKQSVCVEPSLSYGVDTGNVENGSRR